MLNLLPNELHQYSLGDLLRGLLAIRSTASEPNPSWASAIGPGVPIRSGRAAIVLSIKALGLKPGSMIGVPLYCCPVVFKAIKEAGCRPRFLDVDARNFCLSLDDLIAKRAEMDALIAVHMFGNLCDMERVHEAMCGKPIIEDCAQALGSKFNGRLTGSVGTIAVFSFRLGKYLSAGEGAALHTGHSDLRQKIIQSVEKLAQPSSAEEIKHVFASYLRSTFRRKPLWGIMGSSIWRFYNRSTDFMDKSPIIMSRIFRSDLEIARRRIVRIDHMIGTQRTIAEHYIKNLKLPPSMLCLEEPGAFYNRLMFPIVLSSPQQRDDLRTALRKRAISTATPYEEAIEGAAKNYNYAGDCPNAERLLKTTLVIPCHHKLAKRDITHIVRSINEAWADIAPS